MGKLKDQLTQSEQLFGEHGYYVRDLECKARDPIRYEIFHSRLLSTLQASRETAKSISASPMVKEVGELCFALYTPEGDSVCLSTGIMVHVHTMSRCIKWMIEHGYEDEPTIRIREGDFFANNDCFIGGVHVADIMDITPIFYEDELVGWVGGVTHVLEVGGVDPGSMPSSAITRFHEGITLCAQKVAENDTLRRDYEIMIERCTRAPHFWLLDERARIAGCCLIRESVKEIIREFGLEYYRKAGRELIEEARRTFLENVKQRLVPGTYRTAWFIDLDYRDKNMPAIASRDNFTFSPLEMKVERTGRITLDYEGANRWGYHFGNCSPAAMEGGLFVTLTQFLAYDGKVNDGAWMACEMKLPHGSALNPDTIFAGVSAAWALLQPAMGAVYRLLSRGLYARGFREEILVGAPVTPAVETGGTNQYGNPFGTLISELVACGSGARGILDGIDTAYALWNPEADMGNVEAWELIIPQIFIGRRITPDSGGPGKYRGGSGFESTWLVCHSDNVLMANLGFSSVYPCPGIMGGYPSPSSYIHFARGTNVKELIEKKAPLPHWEGPDPENPLLKQLVRARDLRTGADALLFASPFSPYDLFSHFYTGAGGYGDPLGREPRRVLADLANGHTTARAARETYGIAFDPDTGQLDEARTRALRAAKRQERLNRAVPAAEFRKRERQRILDGDLHESVKEAYRSSFRLSEKFRSEFVRYWELPADFAL
ncbi:MAG: hydantoinase B/oxoprolinase family protein [bacterium]